jgi:FlaG/FlaF family flagellin (archaellin)/predicted secreted protein
MYGIMNRLGGVKRNFGAISPVLAVLMMIAVAIAGSLVVYAWIMGYINLSTERSGEAITIQSVFNDGADLLIYVQNVGEGVVQLEKDSCLYVDELLVPCTLSSVPVSDGVATIGQGETAKLRYSGGAALPGEKVEVKVVTSFGTSAESYVYPAGSAGSIPVSVVWSRTYGGDGSDRAYSLVVTSDGGYAVAGSTDSFGAGGIDFWLIKIDAFGYMEWNKTYGGPDYDFAHSLVQTSDGGYVLAGITSSFGAGGYDFWLVKTDAYGNMEWNQTYGGMENDRAYSVVETSDGGYAIAGETESFGFGGYDFWLVKTDVTGDAEWNQTYGGTDWDVGSSLVATSDGGYAIAGYTGPYLEEDFWVVKTDAFGNMEWNQTYGGTEDEIAYSVVEASDGGYAIAGFTSSFGAGEDNCWLVKTDVSGIMEWSKTYGGVDDERAFSLVATSDGGFSLAGRTNSFGAEDFWLIKTDSYGNMEWNLIYEGAIHDSDFSLVPTSDGGYALAGTTGDSEETTDFWLVKIS